MRLQQLTLCFPAQPVMCSGCRCHAPPCGWQLTLAEPAAAARGRQQAGDSDSDSSGRLAGRRRRLRQAGGEAHHRPTQAQAGHGCCWSAPSGQPLDPRTALHRTCTCSSVDSARARSAPGGAAPPGGTLTMLSWKPDSRPRAVCSASMLSSPSAKRSGSTQVRLDNPAEDGGQRSGGVSALACTCDWRFDQGGAEGVSVRHVEPR